MVISPRKANEYVQFPPYHVFQSPSSQRASRDLIALAWRASLIVGAFSIAVVAAFLLLRQYFTGA